MAVEKEQIREFLDIESSELKNFIDSIDAEALIAARELILQAEQNHNRVHVTGIGKPGHVAGYAASLLSSTGTPTYELHGTEAVHGSAGQVLSGDVVIAISNSGETTELKATVETLKSNGARLISLTGKADSWLAKQGDVTLIAGVNQEGDAMNKPPRASIGRDGHAAESEHLITERKESDTAAVCEMASGRQSGRKYQRKRGQINEAGRNHHTNRNTVSS